MSSRNFYIVTLDFDGLAIGQKLVSEGENVVFAVLDHKAAHGKEPNLKGDEEKKKFKHDEELRLKTADGMVEKIDYKEALKRILKDKNSYIIFDFNYAGELADKLRKKGYKVFGSSKLGYEIENNRKAGMSFMKKYYGIEPPQEFEYGKGGVDAALKDIEKEEGKSFVVKPDTLIDTFLPRARDVEKSREELLSFIESNKEELNRTPFILQEKIFGYEVASEVIFSQGKPVIANVDLEVKRKFGSEMGELCGCSGDLLFHQDIDSPLVKIANEPFYRFAKKMNYTGPIDLNVIFKDKKRYYGLEYCGNRPGYNALYTYLSMIKMNVGDFFAGILDGTIKENPEGENYAASIRMFNENKHKENIGFKVPDEKNTWITYSYKEGDTYKTTGADDSYAIVTGGGATPEEAFHVSYENAEHSTVMPNRYYRKDLDMNVYPNPIYRLKRLKEMGLF